MGRVKLRALPHRRRHFPVSGRARRQPGCRASGRGRSESTNSFLTTPDPFGRKATGRSVTCCRCADTRTTQWDTLAECDAIGKAIDATTIEAVTMAAELDTLRAHSDVPLFCADSIGTWKWEIASDTVHGDPSLNRMFAVPVDAGGWRPMVVIVTSRSIASLQGARLTGCAHAVSSGAIQRETQLSWWV